jgi:hypothetical protein
MRTEQEYAAGTTALAAVVQAAIIANVPEWERGAIPQALIAQIEAEGAKAAIDAADAVAPKPQSA